MIDLDPTDATAAPSALEDALHTAVRGGPHAGLDELDAAGLLAASTAAVRARRLAEVADLQVLAQWAAVHSEDPTTGPDGTYAKKVGNVLRQVGGDGTPGVQDFSLGEIALARGTGITATLNALADVLDLIHRLPRLWAVVQSGTAEVYIARRVAKLSRHLPADKTWGVDAAVAAMIAHEAGGRTLAVAEAKIIEADPTLHDQRLEEEKQRRYLRLGRTDEHGLRTLIARVEAGDAAWIDATVHRVADILAPRYPLASPDEIRATALGWLARPADLLHLLLEHTDTDDPDEPASDGEEAEEPQQSRATAFPADLLAALREADWSVLRPKAVLYVHLHQAALTGADAVARVEGLGPLPVTELAALLGHTQLTIKPVLDLAARIRTTAYEHPETVKERVHLTTGGDYWPYATSTSRHLDHDHPTPYNFGPRAESRPPPGQTGTHNSGPLTRTHHRWKTHAGYTSRQSGPGRYAWTTPHGLAYLTNHTGTHPIPWDQAHAIINAPPGVELYFTT